MPILDMRAATFCRSGATLLAPVTVVLNESERIALTCETALAAGIAARLAAGIIKCTSGVVFVGNFDPKIQPVQVKRLVGFWGRDRARRLPPARAYFSYRAALWELDREAALRRGAELLKIFDGLPCDQALELAGALLARPRLVVLDRPADDVRDAAAAAAPEAALFTAYGPADRSAPVTVIPFEMAGSAQ
jgi:ABC-type Na+ transport system ATPase subunit NatA